MVEHSQYSIERLVLTADSPVFSCRSYSIIRISSPLTTSFAVLLFYLWIGVRPSWCNGNNYSYTMEGTFPIYHADIVINIVGRPLTKRSIKVCFQKLSHTFITNNRVFISCCLIWVYNPNLSSSASSHFKPKTFSTSIFKPNIIEKSEILVLLHLQTPFPNRLASVLF